MSARNRELMALIPASLLLTAGFAAIFIQRSAVLSDVSLTYGGIFLGLCFAGHMVIRFTLPYADPYLFPLVAILACFGLVVVYRIDEDLARDQAQWFVIGLILFVVTIIALRDFRILERYRYTIALAGLALLVLPRVPGHRPAGQRRLPGREGRADLLPARRVRQDRDRHLPGRLPARHAAGAGAVLAALPRPDDPALQAPRAAAGGVGRGDADARLHPRPRVLADVLRRVPGADLRGDQPAQLRGRRAGDVRRRRVVLRHHGRPRPGPHRHLAGSRSSPGSTTRRAALPDRQRPVLDGRRRAVRPGPGRVAAEPARAARR